MVCYECGTPAVGQCSECSRFVCNSHVGRAGYDLECTRCLESRQRIEDRIKADHRQKACYSCQRYDDANRKCSRCGRYFCLNHGQDLEYSDWPSRMCYRWTRCVEHAKRDTRGKIHLGCPEVDVSADVAERIGDFLFGPFLGGLERYSCDDADSSRKLWT